MFNDNAKQMEKHLNLFYKEGYTFSEIKAAIQGMEEVYQDSEIDEIIDNIDFFEFVENYDNLDMYEGLDDLAVHYYGDYLADVYKENQEWDETLTKEFEDLNRPEWLRFIKGIATDDENLLKLSNGKFLELSYIR